MALVLDWPGRFRFGLSSTVISIQSGPKREMDGNQFANRAIRDPALTQAREEPRRSAYNIGSSQQCPLQCRVMTSSEVFTGILTLCCQFCKSSHESFVAQRLGRADHASFISACDLRMPEPGRLLRVNFQWVIKWWSFILAG